MIDFRWFQGKTTPTPDAPGRVATINLGPRWNPFDGEEIERLISEGNHLRENFLVGYDDGDVGPYKLFMIRSDHQSPKWYLYSSWMNGVTGAHQAKVLESRVAELEKENEGLRRAIKQFVYFAEVSPIRMGSKSERDNLRKLQSALSKQAGAEGGKS